MRQRANVRTDNGSGCALSWPAARALSWPSSQPAPNPAAAAPSTSALLSAIAVIARDQPDCADSRLVSQWLGLAGKTGLLDVLGRFTDIGLVGAKA